jgi:uncharacterized protein (DUF885 family)
MVPLILALALALAATPAAADDAAVARLVSDYEAWWLADDPITAGRLGGRAALSRLPDVAPAADERRRAALEQFQTRLRAQSGLSPAAALNRDLLAWTVDAQLSRLAFDEARMPLSSDGGFYDTLTYAAATTPIRTAEDARAWVERLEAAPAYYRANLDNARRGVRSGFTQPRSTAETVLKLARLAADAPVDADPLLQPLAALPSEIPVADQADLRRRARVAIERLRPEQRAFATFLEREYLPAARTALGARSLPDGERYYRFLVHDHTTTDMTPDQIHDLGLAEVARIRAEMSQAMVQAGWNGDLQGFIAMLRKDPRFYATSREDLLEKASEIAKRLDDKLPGMFATLPRLPYGVRPVPAELEAGYTTARYFQGSPQQGVAGGYMVNTYALDQRPLYELPALTAHEAVPGHHLQIALAQEAQACRPFGASPICSPPSWRAGASMPSAWAARWASTGPPTSGSASSPTRCGGRAGWLPTPACTGRAGRSIRPGPASPRTPRSVR